MADYNGCGTGLQAGTSFVTPSSQSSFNAKLTAAITYCYQMIGFDAVLTTKITWLVQGAPDYSATTPAALAAIAAAGASTPLRNVDIAAQWPVP